jgi:peptidoglycan/LPS O-acetylase OafA/YrhL
MSDTEASANKKAYLYFPNLDGVRAIAAFMVVISHIEYHKKDYGLPHLGFINLNNLGKIGVTVFFSLSGFLITYLLLKEKHTYQKINFKAFYMRRILRIWPLYFLIVAFGFFVYPAQGSPTALWLTVFFMPHLAFCLNMLPSIFDPIWSIGTEEQFYIFHPHFFRIKKLHNTLIALIVFTLFWITLSFVIRHGTYKSLFITDFSLFLYYARFDNMMIGAIVALLYYNTQNHIFKFRLQSAFNILFKGYAQVLLLLAFCVFTYFFLKHEITQGDIIISILAAFLIVNLCETGTSIYSLNNRVFKYVGKISFGIYLMHKYPLFMMLYVVKTYMPTQSMVWQNAALYIGTFALLIALASISYYGYERYFLRIKSRFQKITQSKAVIQS